MKSYRAISLSIAIFSSLLALVQPVSANNHFFLPGDSFFSVSLTRKLMEEWTGSKDDEFTFSYSRFDGKFVPRGNLGYRNLKVTGISKTFRTSLIEAYWRYSALKQPVFRLVDEGESELRQINGVVALIYNQDFDGPIGLKLNENWQMEGLQHYRGLFKTAHPVALDWQLGRQYPPLKLDPAPAPFAHLAPTGTKEQKTVDPAIETKAENIKIILVGFAEEMKGDVDQSCPNLQDILDDVKGTEYIVCDPKGYTISTCKGGGEWVNLRKASHGEVSRR